MQTQEVGITLLLVDDEEDFREAAREALNRQGFHVADADSGERALEYLESTRPDVVVLDLRMGGMDGISTLREIRKSDRSLPVVILTGHGKYEDALAGIQLGVVDFVQKPVDLKHLGARIRHLVERAGGDKSLRERSIEELMVPQSCYLRIYTDQTAQDAVALLRSAQMQPTREEDADKGRRTLLVFDRDQRFVGLLRAEDLVRLTIPAWLESPYSSYFTGMFLAQAKVVGHLLVCDIVRPPSSIEADAPLMEAAHMIVSGHLSHLAVMSRGQLAGILRPEDLYRELAAPLIT